MIPSFSRSLLFLMFRLTIYFSSCRETQNRCLERLSRLYVHEARSLETCGMCSAHSLECIETMEIKLNVTLPVLNRNGSFMETSSFTMWNGGIGCSPGNPNLPGHCLKYLGGKGTGGVDAYTRGQKMMECAVLSRFCHLPVSSYLQGTSDLELQSVRFGVLFLKNFNSSNVS